MDLIVHIGKEKTGTTSLQEALYRNKEALASHGFHFLQCAGNKNNRKLAVYCLNPDTYDDYCTSHNIANLDDKKRFNDEFHSDFIEELNSLGHGIHTVLMSSEQLSTRLNTPAKIMRFHDLVSPHFARIKVLCYLREQCDAAISLYKTSLISGKTLEFDDFISTCHSKNSRFDYLAMINRWSSIFGRESIVLKIYNKEDFWDGDLVSDYFHSVTPDLVELVERKRPFLNTSIRPFGQALLLSLNRYWPKSTGNKRFGALRRRLMHAIVTSFPGRGFQATEEQYNVIYNSFLQSNKDLSKKYLGKNDALFEYLPPAGKSNRSRYCGFTISGYYKFTKQYIKAYSSLFKGIIEYCKFMIFHFLGIRISHSCKQ